MLTLSVGVLPLLMSAKAVASSPFNASVRFRIDALSPMVNLTYASQLNITTWRYSEELGMIWSAPKVKDSLGYYYEPQREGYGDERVLAAMDFDFVGTGIEIEGQIGMGGTRTVDVSLWIEGNEWASGQGNKLNKKFQLTPWSFKTPYYTLMRETLSNRPWPYHGRLTVPFDLDFRFVCLWFYIPVRTQGPLDILAWQSQSLLVPLVKPDGSVSDAVKLWYLSNWSAARLRRAHKTKTVQWSRSTIAHDIHGDTVFLREQTELTYKIPEHTTLVEVLGPVGRENDMDDGIEGDPGLFECYAYLDPPPFWWVDERLPTSLSLKPQNDIQRTLFLFPIDPSVRYTLFVGPTTDRMRCPVSHIRSYSYYYDYNFKPGSKHITQPVLVGSAVGSGVGGAVLGLVVALLFIRVRRIIINRAQTPFEVDTNTQPEPIEPFMAQLAQEGEPDHAAYTGELPATSSSPPSVPTRNQTLPVASGSANRYSGTITATGSLPTEGSTGSAAPSTGLHGSTGRRYALIGHDEDDLPPKYSSEFGDQGSFHPRPAK